METESFLISVALRILAGVFVLYHECSSSEHVK